jgi:hypothetical protein
LVKRENVLPLCVATCSFHGNAVLDKTDISGIDFASERNKNNNCKFYSKLYPFIHVFRDAHKLKKSILEVLEATEGTPNDVREMRIHLKGLKNNDSK